MYCTVTYRITNTCAESLTIITLQEYTSYVFYLKACTQVGCTSGASVTLSTAQLRPSYVDPPVLTALGINLQTRVGIVDMHCKIVKVS